jgi:hypothetical protein
MGKKAKNQAQESKVSAESNQAKNLPPQGETPQMVSPTQTPQARPAVMRQLAVFLDKQPESLLELCKHFSEHKINIEAMSITDTVDHSVVRLIVDKPEDTKKMFAEVGVMCVENELLQVTLSDKPGALRDFCRQLSEAGINIEYAYGGCSPKSAKINVYVRVIDIKKTMAVLQR